jgi:hypothetical protein
MKSITDIDDPSLANERRDNEAPIWILSNNARADPTRINVLKASELAMLENPTIDNDAPNRKTERSDKVDPSCNSSSTDSEAPSRENALMETDDPNT